MEGTAVRERQGRELLSESKKHIKTLLPTLAGISIYRSCLCWLAGVRQRWGEVAGWQMCRMCACSLVREELSLHGMVVFIALLFVKCIGQSQFRYACA